MDTISPIFAARTGDNRQRAGFVSKFVVVVSSALIWLDERLAKRRSRLALLELTDNQLKDIGISRADAHREGLRSFLD
jgi:uncharacterized protein YjiS (DUF1127 family)